MDLRRKGSQKINFLLHIFILIRLPKNCILWECVKLKVFSKKFHRTNLPLPRTNHREQRTWFSWNNYTHWRCWKSFFVKECVIKHVHKSLQVLVAQIIPFMSASKLPFLLTLHFLAPKICGFFCSPYISGCPFPPNLFPLCLFFVLFNNLSQVPPLWFISTSLDSNSLLALFLFDPSRGRHLFLP